MSLDQVIKKRAGNSALFCREFCFLSKYFVLSEAELACKSEADDHTYYVMKVRKHSNSSEFVKIF